LEARHEIRNYGLEGEVYSLPEPASLRNCRRRRCEPAIAEGKKPLTTRGSVGAS